MSVTCDYCGNTAKMVRGDFIYPYRSDLKHLKFYYCDNGHEPAYVGCHKPNRRRGYDGYEPLGRLANKELRAAKVNAHFYFDSLWKNGKFKSREKAYHWLADQLHLNRKQCHIGMFDVDMCQRVVDVSIKLIKEKG